MRVLFSISTIFLILLLFMVSSTFAGQRSHPKFEIEIANIDSSEYTYKGVIPGTTISVPIIINKASRKITGFDFVIDYNTSALTLLDVHPGSYLEDNNWEQFEYEFLPDTFLIFDTLCPVINIRGSISEDGNSGHRPAGINDGDTLAIMSFYVSSDLTLECQSLPIEFFWGECRDNIIYSWPRGKVFHASKLFNPDDSLIFDFISPPSYYNSDCIYTGSDRGRGFNKRAIDYKNGRVKIICLDGIDSRGDINLNGIDYEVADAVVFTNYFIIGLDAFAVNVDGQIAATDVNADGIPLTVEDLVHLIRIIIGDALPYGGTIPIDSFSGTLQIENNENLITVGGEFEKAVGAVHLCFYAPDHTGGVSLTNAANHMTIKYALKNDSLKILIFDMNHRALSADINNFVNIEYSGDKPVLAYASAGGHKSEKVDLTFDYMTDSPVESTLPDKFALHQNYPNPFNPYTEIKFNLPRSSNVTLEIFDITGRKVATLINQKLASGPHSVIWNGRDGTDRELSTGIYLYRLSTGEYSDTKKMLLLK